MVKGQWVFSMFIILFCLPGLNFDMLHIECNSAIAFTGDYDIYVADLCTNQYIQLTNDEANYYPAVSPDGEHIVFATVDHLDVMDVDGSNRLTITDDNVGYARFPAWSPDGQYISFSGSGEMYFVRADGTDLQQLTSSRITGSGSASAWSPDGQTIAFVAHHSESQHAIYFVHLPDLTVVEVMLPLGEYPQDFITWSPDNQQVAFTIQHYICLLDVDTLLVEYVTPLGPFDAIGSPGWSPDGSQMVFEGIVYEPPPRHSVQPFQIYVMDMDSKHIMQLTFGGDGRWPRWSPDGETIAYVSAQVDDLHWAIYVMSKDGSRQTKISQPENTENQNPIWLSSF